MPLRATITRIEPADSHAVTYWLRPEKPLRYTAGQFIEVTLPHHPADSRGERRWFTLSSSPTEPELAITSVFAVQGGSSFKQHLRTLKEGMALTISEPMGDFVLPKDASVPLLFVAVGIGATPFRSMTKWLADSGEKRRITLWHAVRHADERTFAALFQQYYQDTFVVFDGTGRQALTPAAIARHLAGMPTALAYIAGPEAFVEDCTKKLPALGVDSYRIVGDYFPGYQENA